ncbi:MAG: type II toxin-antitoxin system VapC family toxin [Myxococcota bacterium]
MIALDTNVLVRFMVDDDAEQAARARDRLKRAMASRESCHISDVVVCEFVWVLSRAYKFTRAEISSAIRNLLAARYLSFSDREALWRAVARFDSRGGDLADYVIREHADAAGAGVVVTFDAALLKEDGFVAP